MNIVAVDVGTLSMRGLLVNRRGETLMCSQSCYQPTFLEHGGAEQDPLTWKRSLIDIIRSVVAYAQSKDLPVDAVSLTSQRSSAIAVDASGTPLHNAIMWQDTRASRVCDALREHTSAVYGRTGLRLSPVLAAPKFAWLRTERNHIYERAHKLLTVADYLVCCMTQRFVTDHTYGSRTLLMNLQTLEWDPELLKLFQIDAGKLCDLVPQGSVVGHTTESFQQLTSLPSGTPVISAGGDQQCGSLGAGVLEPDCIQITSGTGSYVSACSEHPWFDPNMQLLCGVAAIPGRFLLEASILTTSVVYAWIGEVLYGSQEPQQDVLARLGRDAEAAPAGAHGVLMLPHLQGRGSPDWNSHARGTLANMTLATTRADMVRAVLEGIAAEIAESVELLLSYVQKDAAVLVSGGLSRLPLFNQMQADMCDREITAPENAETTAFGAWISAAVSLGLYPTYRQAFEACQAVSPTVVFKPNAANVALYRRVKRDRAHLYGALTKASELSV